MRNIKRSAASTAASRWAVVSATAATLAVAVRSEVGGQQGSRAAAALAPGVEPDLQRERADAARIVGPESSENNCASCHAREADAWRRTRHALGFQDRHRSDRAREILGNVGARSMRQGTASNTCRQCHYTSVLVQNRVDPTWGVSCESCHGPARDWVGVHDKAGGRPDARSLEWGGGRTESGADRAARLGAAEAGGMVHAGMWYELASNCLRCHAVPDETLVNRGNHRAGSDFDLVAWSQGEVRHTFLSSPGAPGNPTNRPATDRQRRRLYVVGAMVDLEFSLRNLAGVKEKGGTFHRAMVDRVNGLRTRVGMILQAVDIPELADAVAEVPSNLDLSAVISPELPDRLGAATRRFLENHDGPELVAIDGQIPTVVRRMAHEPPASP